jgi:hypothetical protein
LDSPQPFEKSRFGQGNPRKCKDFSLVFLGFPCTKLALRLSRGVSDQALTAPVRRGGFRCGMAEAQAKIASRRLTFIVKYQNLSMPLMRASLTLREPWVSGVGLTPQGPKRR